MSARRNEVVAFIAGAGRTIPITERLTINVTPSMAARLARMTLDSGWSAEKFILDLLDDALPAPSQQYAHTSAAEASASADKPSAHADDPSIGRSR